MVVARCSDGASSDGSCECEEGWLPAGQGIVEHAGKLCTASGDQQQIGLSTAVACKWGCFDDADCNYATFAPTYSGCYFSSACDFRTSGSYIVYVSLVLAAGGRGRSAWGAASAASAPSSLPNHSLFSLS